MTGAHAIIPDWQAFPQGFKDGREARQSQMRWCVKEARPEYARGYTEGREHAIANKEDKPMTEAQRIRREYPRGPVFVVNVTEEHIQHTKARNSSHCMIAMGVRAAMPQATSPSADIQTIRFSDPDKGLRYTYLTPRVAQIALIDFDQGELPTPFSFKLTGALVTKMARKTPCKTPEARTTLIKEPGSGSVPRRVGGRPPPQSRLAKRREFGLRSMKR